MIKLVAFDWNGTLFSDTAATLESANKQLKYFCIKPITLRTYQKYFDTPIKKSYAHFGVTEAMWQKKALQATEIFHQNYERRAVQVRSRAYAKKVLAWLRRNHIQSIIFSNHINEQIRTHLKRLKIEKYISKILANPHIHVTGIKRSKQEKLKQYLDEKHLSNSEVLVIGDTVEEIEIGWELGIKTVAITHGNCSRVRLKAMKPDYLINSLKELIKIIQNL